MRSDHARTRGHGLATGDDPLAAGTVQQLGCYSQMHTARARVLAPPDVDELALIFDRARLAGRRMTLRAGGNAFDGQSLGDDLVISIERLDTIGEVFEDAGEPCITVGAGATWGRI